MFKIKQKKQKYDFKLAIDPGVNGSGYAFFYNGDLKDTGVFSPRSTDHEFYDKGLTVCEKFESLFQNLRLHYPINRLNAEVHIEYPAFFGGASGSMVARRGDLVKLAWIVGMITEKAIQHYWTPILVPVNDWKGQLPKEVVVERIKEDYPEVENFNVKSHAWDAVGIGLYALGRFK